MPDIINYKMLLFVFSLYSVGVSIFLYNFLDTRVPELNPEIMKVKLMDGGMRLCGYVVR